MSGQTMYFPDTVEEFMERYEIVDSKQVYTNGVELVPIFRMKQWFEQHPEPHWIHVSEQLPEEEVDVLCVTHAGAMFVASYGQLYFDPNEKGWITTEFNRFCTGTVYAWTDLPEKPKGVTE